MDEGNLYSVERLVAFGMNLSAATQLAESMNLSLQRMGVPGVDNDARDGIGSPRMQDGAIAWDKRSGVDDVYYAAVDGEAKGPYSVTELLRLIVDGHIPMESYVWKPGMSTWQLAETVPEIVRLVAIVPPPIPADG